MIAVYTGAIVCIHKYVDGLTMNLPQTFPVLGVVTGLLLVFRTNTAYDRLVYLNDDDEDKMEIKMWNVKNWTIYRLDFTILNY